MMCEEANLVVIRERGKRLVESHALELLVIGVDPEHLELGRRDSNKWLQVLFECC